MTELKLNANAAIPMRYLTRHVAIYGATGTGKTTTVAAIVEQLGKARVPTLVLDAKGDLETLASGHNALLDSVDGGAVPRLLNFSDMGPLLTARALDLSDAQTGVLEIAYAYADAVGYGVATPAQLSDVLSVMDRDRERVEHLWGHAPAASINSIRRALLRLETHAPGCFGDPAIRPAEAARANSTQVWRCGALTSAPGLYGAAAAHVLRSAFERMPEAGDVERPRLAIVIDEAHLIFRGATSAVVAEMIRVVRLIRSRGVALIFATQSPVDLPSEISGQIGTRIQHALRAATVNGMAELAAAAQTLPGVRRADVNSVMDQIKALGVGEALVSAPGERGVPQPVARIQIVPGSIRPQPVNRAAHPKPRTKLRLRPFDEVVHPVGPTLPTIDGRASILPDWMRGGWGLTYAIVFGGFGLWIATALMGG